ncbi:MAG: hypothetical protein HOP33_13660 [Verrucomicrobia bacterium]|nr:hypothetical protein [Verrucomicrobiota bacterium]
MSKLLQTLSAELERPRVVSSQVAKHIADTHGVEREKLGAFLVNELPALEDYEIDLILSPLFTPTLQEQSVFAELLGRESVPAANWPELVQQLATRPTRAHLVTEDDAVHPVPLREVTIERFVHRLRLDATIPGPVFGQIEQCPEGIDRALLKAVARRAVWENPSRHDLLICGIASFAQHPDDLAALLKLVETYLPADTGNLLGHIPNWKQIVRQEINDAGSKPFFNERVQDLHGGGRDQRRQDNTRVLMLEKEFRFLERLEKLLATNPPQPA